MSTFDGFRFHRLITVPRPDSGRGDPNRGGEARRDPAGPLAASLAGSHGDLLASGAPGPALLTAWVRSPQEQQLRFLVGGRPFFPPAVGPAIGPALASAGEREPGPGGERPVLYPPGAVGVDVAEHDAVGLFDRLTWWVPCSGRADALWAPPPGKASGVHVRRGSFDSHVAHLGVPLAWLVIAEPLVPEELKPELDLLVNEILPLSRGEVGEAKRIALERKQARHRDLSRAQDGGAWRLRVLVGALSERAASAAAAMLCAATELEGLPYVVAPAGPPTSLPRAITGASFVASTDLLVALARPPDRELPGLRLVEPHTFDVTPDLPDAGGLHLGAVLDEAHEDVGPLALSHESLNRHTFVCGATGAGKSQTVRHLLTEATRSGIPWLVVEPAKAEYARMATRIADLGGDVIVIRPGDRDTAPAGLNPFEPAEGFPLQTHVDRLRALFLAAFESWEPFPQVMSTALVRCYEQFGWDLVLGEPAHRGSNPRYPTLGDLQRVAAEVVADIGYGAQATADVGGFIKVRLSSLRLGTTGRFFEGGHPLRFDRLRERNVVLEIEDVGDDADKAFLMGAVLMRLSEDLWVANRAHPSEGLSHLTVIEEAHRLLRRAESGASDATAKAVEMFASLLAEVRAYGEGLVIAEQIPSKLTPDVIKNTAVKIVHRLPAKDDRDSVGATMNVDEAQSRHLVTLVPGQGAVFTDGMDRPLLVQVPDGTQVEARGAARPAPVTALIGRRSASCGAECVAQACTLRDMVQARHLLAERPWLVVWAELTVLAHLAGFGTPAVDRAGLPALDAVLRSPRIFDCALSHAVDAAVVARTEVLQPTVDPDDLAAHCCTSIRAVLDEVDPDAICGPHGLRYLARPYRWHEILAALEDVPPDAPRDARSAEWEERLGRHVQGDTAAEQRDVVESWWNAVLDDRPARDRVTFGIAQPSALELAIGSTRSDPAWRDQVQLALQPFRVDWPDTHLLPDSRDGSSDG